MLENVLLNVKYNCARKLEEPIICPINKAQKMQVGSQKEISKCNLRILLASRGEHRKLEKAQVEGPLICLHNFDLRKATNELQLRTVPFSYQTP
jgi:hypothetical protein